MKGTPDMVHDGSYLEAKGTPDMVATLRWRVPLIGYCRRSHGGGHGWRTLEVRLHHGIRGVHNTGCLLEPV